MSKLVSLAFLAMAATAAVSHAAVIADYQADFDAPAAAAAKGWSYYRAHNGVMTPSAMSTWAEVDQLLGWAYGTNSSYPNSYAVWGYAAPVVYMLAQKTPGQDFQGNILPGDDENWFVARWTSNVAGDLQIAGNFNGMRTSGNYGSELYVSLNGGSDVLLASAPATDTALHGYTLPLTNVLVGDTIDIKVRAVTHNWSNETLLSSQISTVPEPTSLALVGLSGLVLMRRRRA